jgi:hypothetical protein
VEEKGKKFFSENHLWHLGGLWSVKKGCVMKLFVKSISNITINYFSFVFWNQDLGLRGHRPPVITDIHYWHSQKSHFFQACELTYVLRLYLRSIDITITLSTPRSLRSWTCFVIIRKISSWEIQCHVFVISYSHHLSL